MTVIVLITSKIHYALAATTLISPVGFPIQGEVRNFFSYLGLVKHQALILDFLGCNIYAANGYI